MSAKRIVLVFIVFCLVGALGRGGGRGGGSRGGGSRGGSHGGSRGGGWSWGSWGSSGRTQTSHTYPSSNTGLSGSGHGYGGSSHTYPSSNTGLSGSSGGSHSYPSSNTGLSGNYGGSHTYPSSNTGLSGNRGTGNRGSYSTYGGNYHPRQTWSSGSGYHHTPYVPAYHQAPQHVYIHEYRNSGSRFSDLLTGLALYNLVRSHNHNHYYYHDDYSRARYPDSYSKPIRSQDEATCSLRIDEQGSVSRLKIPCEIVSTFASINESANATAANVKAANCTTADGVKVSGDLVNGSLANATLERGWLVDGSVINGTLVNGTRVNCTAVAAQPAAVNPLSVKGSALSVSSDTRCWVEVRTRQMQTSKEVDCTELIRYSRMPEPASPKPLVPRKETYTSWLNNPPWWLSIFFAA